MSTLRISPDQRRIVEAGVRRLHLLGPRALAEFLLELAPAERLLPRLSDYGQITPEMLRAVGGDRFPPHVSPVPEDRRAA